MQIVSNTDTLHKMSHPFLEWGRGGAGVGQGWILDSLIFTTFLANSADDKLVIVICYPEK